MALRIRMGARENRSILAACMAGVICTALSVTGFWVVLSGAELSGGVPFIPPALNQGLGRGLMGVGAVFTAVLAAYAFFDARRLLRERSVGDKRC